MGIVYHIHINTGCAGNCDVTGDQKDSMLVNRSKIKSGPFSRYNSLGTRQSRHSCKLSLLLIKIIPYSRKLW